MVPIIPFLNGKDYFNYPPFLQPGLVNGTWYILKIAVINEKKHAENFS